MGKNLDGRKDNFRISFLGKSVIVQEREGRLNSQLHQSRRSASSLEAIGTRETINNKSNQPTYQKKPFSEKGECPS